MLSGNLLSRASAAIFQTTPIPFASLKSRISGLDELRGLAALWVMLCHGAPLTTWAPAAFANYGYHGVVLFFMISGYLITKILLDGVERGEPLQNFYIRRFLRIWPLMIVAIILGALWKPEFADAAIYNLLLVNNYAMAVDTPPVFRTDVMWSLAIEEQFYIFWPLATLLMPRRIQPYFLVIVVILGFCFCASVLPSGRMSVAKTTHGAMQYIALGCLIAYGRVGIIAAIAAGVVSMIAVARFGVPPMDVMPELVWYVITWLLFAWICVTLRHKPLLNFAPLAHIGRLCYGIYIIHFFVTAVTLYFFRVTPFIGPVFFIVTTYTAALASFHLVEKPAIGLRSKIEGSPRAQISLLLGVVSTILVSVVLMVSRIGA